MIAVTGATGFVGRALCELLASKRIAHRSIGRSARLGVVGIGAIGPATDWRAALSGADAVVHLAARVHHMHETEADPLAAYRSTNVEGTLQLARQAASLGVRRFVFVSSVKVNGEATEDGKPFTPQDRPAPLDPYGLSKLEAETGLRALAERNGLELVIIRPPLVYGAGVGANFGALVSLVERGLPLPLGAIRNKRSFVSVENLTDLIVCCLHHQNARGETFMAADGTDLSTPELLRALARSLNRPVRLIPVPVWSLRAGAALLGKSVLAQRLTASLQIDIGETVRKLGWTPPFSVETAFTRAAAKGWSHSRP